MFLYYNYTRVKYMKRKAFTIIELLGVIVLLAIISLIVYPNVIKVIKSSKDKAYNTQVNLFKTAARNYVTETTNGKTDDLSINLAKLVELGYLKDQDLIDPRNNEPLNSYCVKANYNSSVNQFEYEFTNTNCIQSLVETLKEQYNASNTTGLLKDATGYYYKGTNAEVSNNWVWWAGILWRVMSIDNSDNLTMISSGPLIAIQPASAAWTTKDMYDNSYINTWLNSTGTDGVLYKGLTTTDKSKIVDSTFNIGIYTNPTEITTTQHFGLLDETQYTKGGGAGSYLDIKDWFGLGNRYSTSSVRNVYVSGGLGSSDPAGADGARAVVKITDITITEGDSTLGTISNPYKETSTSTNTNNIKVGEYVSVPYTSATKYCNSTSRCLFRVVSIDSNSIKVTLNGLLNTASQFGSTSTYTSGNTIDTMVSTFVNTIPSTYRYEGNDKTFGIGTYGYTSGVGINYNVVKTSTITQNYGLPVVGELFTGNDIDMSFTVTDPKTFIDATTIENASLSYYYW